MSVKLHIVGVRNEVNEEKWCILSVQTRLTKNPGMISFWLTNRVIQTGGCCRKFVVKKWG